ncbi:MAG: iron uptake transporter deferrochelatase/peroxidase subunit [Actinomycetota bacterium]
MTEDPAERAISRRQLVGALGAGIAASGAIGTAVAAGASAGSRSENGIVAETTAAAIPFHGSHQAGIITPAQDNLHFAAFDVTTEDRLALRDVLQRWTDAARRMTAGQEAGPVGAFNGIPEAPPDDTGEAAGLPAFGLTITIGFGSSLFDHPNQGDRFGLAGKRPDGLRDLPSFPADEITAENSGGDLCIQACANDPAVASHAIRNLARIGFGTVSMRWSQLGFGRTSSTTRDQETPRNLFGQKDGTMNLHAEDTAALDEHLWVSGSSTATRWFDGGSYLVARRIRMHIETWDRTSLTEQEQIIGRTKGSGAPLTGGGEFDEPDFTATGSDGELVISPVAHVQLAHPSRHGGARILRRGYSFIDGNDKLGRMNAGLFFLSYQRDPEQFIRIQRELARSDVLNEYIEHTASGVWACPPGLTDKTQSWAGHLFS